MIFLLLLLTISNNNIFSDNCIFNYWLHSNEEDDNKQIVYRPQDYDLPTLRGGRDGMEIIKENQTIIFYDLNPRDGSPEKNTGYFKIKEPNILNYFVNVNNNTI